MNDMLTIRLSEKLAEALRAEAEQTGLTKSQIVRQSLELRLKRSRQLSVMSRHFGTLRGPVDLSTNKPNRKKWGFGAVLEIPPADSAQKAVKVQIVRDTKSHYSQ